MKLHFAFVGLMGCGKSTVGSLAARRLRMRFVDLDACLVARYGPIADIFAEQGEAGFRAHEYAMLEEIVAGPQVLLSTGGGLLTHPPSRRLLTQVITIYLDVSVAALTQRLRDSAIVRPLVGALPTEQRVSELYEARKALYGTATYRINGEQPLVKVVDEVVQLVRSLGAV